MFAIRFPFPGQSMSRWFQFVATSIRLDIEYRPEFKYDDRQGTLKGDLYVRLFKICVLKSGVFTAVP